MSSKSNLASFFKCIFIKRTKKNTNINAPQKEINKQEKYPVQMQGQI